MSHRPSAGGPRGHRPDVDAVHFAWSVALIVTAGTLPAGMVRALAYRSGSVDHTPGMRMVATVVLAIGLVGLVCFLALSVALLAT